MTNMLRKDGDTAHPLLGGDPIPLIGNYDNPILKPEAAEIVKKISEVSKAGLIFPDPSNQCGPYQPPYAFSIQIGLELVQTKDEIVMLFQQDDQIRHIRMNSKHPEKVTPTPMGDAIGWYEGDTLVVDTVGVKVLPVSMVDRYGTPFSEGMHLVERYRLIEATHAKAEMERHELRAGRVGGPPGAVPLDPNYPKALQVEFTVEDPKYFTTPWTARATYRRSMLEWSEQVCAENIVEYWPGMNTAVPQDNTPDF
ncbi:MAG TPA: hypothetical protein VFB75_20755 [Burkholderiales bacterium]|nr:hypothetical protein [Burkholderiales bacterium]